MRTPHIVALGLIVVGLVVSVRAYWEFTVDDAYITYRYSENLAGGHGLRWNPDGEVVEGYTAFLWMALLALTHLVGLGTVLTSKVLGIAMCLATLWIVLITVRVFLPDDLPGRSLYPLLGCLWFTLIPETGWHAVSGMETAGFSLLVTAFGALWIRSAHPRWLALTALLLGLMRPDGNLIAVVTFLTAYFVWPEARQSKFWGNVLALYVLPGAIYFALRAWYFGHLFPAPFEIKVVSDLPGQSGVEAVMAFATNHGVLGLLTALTIVRAPRRLWPLAAAVVAFLVFYLIPTHIMGYGYRFLAPVLPLLVVLATAGLAECISLARSTRWLSVVAGVVLLMMAAEGLRLGRRWPRALDTAQSYATGLRAAHIPLAESLRDIDSTGASLLAVEDAGALSYLSGWQSLDLLGLNDASIAFGGFSVAQVTLRSPDVVVLVSESGTEYRRWGWDDQGLYQALLDQGMELTNVLTFRASDYYLHVLARPGAVADHLRATLPAPPDPGV